MLGAQCGQRFARHRRARRHLWHALPQLLRTEQIGVAPGRTFSGIAELLEGIGEQRAGGLVVGVGEHQVTHGLRDKAKFAPGQVLGRARKDRIRATHILDVFPA